MPVEPFVCTFALYPNPTTSEVILRHPENAQITRVMVLAPDGRSSEASFLPLNDASTLIHVAQLPAGLYQVVISLSDNVSHAFKLSINR